MLPVLDTDTFFFSISVCEREERYETLWINIYLAPIMYKACTKCSRWKLLQEIGEADKISRVIGQPVLLFLVGFVWG